MNYETELETKNNLILDQFCRSYRMRKFILDRCGGSGYWTEDLSKISWDQSRPAQPIVDILAWFSSKPHHHHLEESGPDWAHENYCLEIVTHLVME